MKYKILAASTALLLVFAVIFIIVIINDESARRLEITAIIDVQDDYSCQVNVEDEDIVKYVKNYSLNEKEHFDDGKTHINFVFEGIKKGRTTVTIKCFNNIDGSVLFDETFKIMVNNKLNTSIYLMEK